jgi:hypothetical protein
MGWRCESLLKEKGVGISVMRCARMDTLFPFISGVVMLRSYPR